MAEAVIDASAMVDLLLGGPLGDSVASRISGHTLHGPAHIDAECLSALGRLHRAGHLDRLADALYVELASSLGLQLVTTDTRLRAVRLAQVVTP